MNSCFIIWLYTYLLNLSNLLNEGIDELIHFLNRNYTTIKSGNYTYISNVNGHSKWIFAYSNEYIDFSLWNIIKLSYIVSFCKFTMTKMIQKDLNMWPIFVWHNVIDFMLKSENRILRGGFTLLNSCLIKISWHHNELIWNLHKCR